MKYGSSEAGKKDALSRSAEYPYDFGLAVAALVPNREERPRADAPLDLDSYAGVDHLGSLDDLTKGRTKAWWRQAYSIK